MHLKHIKLVIISLLTVSSLFGQSINQAYLFSQTRAATTARSAGIGGSMGALGGDVSSIGINPAGLAIYRRSEYTFTPSLEFKKISNTIIGDTLISSNVAQDRNRAAFSFSNLGIVFASRPKTKWRTVNISLGYNRIADFKQKSYLKGKSKGSIANMFLDLATVNGQALPAGELDDYLAGLAFDVSAIDDDLDADGNLEYYNDFQDNPDGLVTRTEAIEQWGGIKEFSIGIGANLRNKWLLGANIGIPSLDYTHRKTYVETNDDNEIPYFDRLEFSDTVSIEGTGVNLKLGAIFWAGKSFRIGASIHTPTVYSLKDTYDTSVRYAYTFQGVSQDTTSIPYDIRELEYRFTSPWKFIGSAGLVIAKRGLLTAEVEYTTYGTSKYKVTDSDASTREKRRVSTISNGISNELESVLTTRLGAEFLVKPFVIRAGYNWQGDAKKSIDESFQQFSAGIGLGKNKWYLDAGFIHTITDGFYSPYTRNSTLYPQKIEHKFKNSQILLSFRYRFS